MNIDWDRLAPKIIMISFIGVILIFAASIHKTGGNLYGQMGEIRSRIRRLEVNLKNHTHERHMNFKAVFDEKD